jgi:hypothetical protein
MQPLLREACQASLTAPCSARPQQSEIRLRRRQPLASITGLGDSGTSPVGTKRTLPSRRSMSALEVRADNICSMRAFRLLTHLGHRPAADRLCLPRLPADPGPCACHDRGLRLSRRARQCVWLAKCHCARARDCGLPRLGAVRENQAGAHSSAGMGRGVCLAGEQRTTVPSAGATHSQRDDKLRDRIPGRGRSAPGLYAFSGPHLAWRADKICGSVDSIRLTSSALLRDAEAAQVNGEPVSTAPGHSLNWQITKFRITTIYLIVQ